MSSAPVLPGLDCGLCGYPTCEQFQHRLTNDPEMLKRCLPLSANTAVTQRRQLPVVSPSAQTAPHAWVDSLGREFDFLLEHFPEDPGPREIILPRNPLLTRELEIKPGDLLLGRPLGMSCGCPVTHCGVAQAVDTRCGVITWCITGHLLTRQKQPKDLGYYSAEAYEGIVRQARVDLRLGQRYFFQPTLCMLQWRHSGLINYVNKISGGLQIRLEGLWIG